MLCKSVPIYKKCIVIRELKFIAVAYDTFVEAAQAAGFIERNLVKRVWDVSHGSKCFHLKALLHTSCLTLNL